MEVAWAQLSTDGFAITYERAALAAEKHTLLHRWTGRPRVMILV